MPWLYILLVLLAGMGSPVQAGMNAKLNDVMGGPAAATLANFLIGVVPLLAFLLVRGLTLPSAMVAAQAPWWTWLGGLIGVYFVVVTLLSANQLGAALLIVLLVAGQVMSSLAVDHFGLFGYEVHEINAWRLVGAALVVGGVVLIQQN